MQDFIRLQRVRRCFEWNNAYRRPMPRQAPPDDTLPMPTPGEFGLPFFAKKGCPRESGSTLFLVEGVSRRLFDPPFSGKRGVLGSLGVTHFAKKGCPGESGSTLFLVEGVSRRLFDPPFSGKRGMLGSPGVAHFAKKGCPKDSSSGHFSQISCRRQLPPAHPV